MWDLFVFAVIGLLVGAAARLCYRNKGAMRVMGTMLLGMVGAMLGGLISRPIWPAADGELFSGALLTSLCGAVLVLVLWPWVVFIRGNSPAHPPAS
jgi:uncharacterized membrane protein YeaQ/YmgE (transglycosylase-associated protein family)